MGYLYYVRLSGMGWYAGTGIVKTRFDVARARIVNTIQNIFFKNRYIIKYVTFAALLIMFQVCLGELVFALILPSSMLLWEILFRFPHGAYQRFREGEGFRFFIVFLLGAVASFLYAYGHQGSYAIHPHAEMILPIIIEINYG